MKGKKTGGREKGTPNKNSRRLLHLLTSEHNFNVIEEVLALYREISDASKPLVIRALENAEAHLSPTTGFSEDELEFLNGSQAKRWTMLEKLLAYCYPKLRSMELGTASEHDKIIFNIQVPNKIEEKT
jgi:hypothetical protein